MTPSTFLVVNTNDGGPGSFRQGSSTPMPIRERIKFFLISREMACKPSPPPAASHSLLTPSSSMDAAKEFSKAHLGIPVHLFIQLARYSGQCARRPVHRNKLTALMGKELFGSLRADFLKENAQFSAQTAVGAIGPSFQAR